MLLPWSAVCLFMTKQLLSVLTQQRLCCCSCCNTAQAAAMCSLLAVRCFPCPARRLPCYCECAHIHVLRVELQCFSSGHCPMLYALETCNGACVASNASCCKKTAKRDLLLAYDTCVHLLHCARHLESAVQETSNFAACRRLA